MSLSSEHQNQTVADLEDRIRLLEEQNAAHQTLISRLQVRDDVARILAEDGVLESAAVRILQVMCDALGWQVGGLWVPDPTVTAMRCVKTWSTGGDAKSFEAASQGRMFPAGTGIPGRVWSTREALWIEDLGQEADLLPRYRAASQAHLQSAFAFPVMAGEEVAAVLEFFGTAKRPVDDNLLHTSIVIGYQIGLFVERRRTEHQLQRQARISALRADVASALAGVGDVRSLLQQCTDAIVANIGAAFARIWILNPSDNILELNASSGLYTHINGAHSRIPVGAFKIGWIAANAQPHITNSVQDDPRVTDREWAKHEGMRAFAGYPLILEKHVVGVIAMFARQALEPFVLEELQPIAGAIAQFLERRRASDELRRSEDLKAGMLEAALDAVIAMNHQGRIIEFNPAAEEMFGHKREAVVGKLLSHVIIPARFRDAHQLGMARYLTTGISEIVGHRISVTALHRSGTEFPVELSVTRIPGDGPPLFTGFVRHLNPPQTEPEATLTSS